MLWWLGGVPRAHTSKDSSSEYLFLNKIAANILILDSFIMDNFGSISMHGPLFNDDQKSISELSQISPGQFSSSFEFEDPTLAAIQISNAHHTEEVGMRY